MYDAEGEGIARAIPRPFSFTRKSWFLSMRGCRSCHPRIDSLRPRDTNSALLSRHATLAILKPNPSPRSSLALRLPWILIAAAVVFLCTGMSAVPEFVRLGPYGGTVRSLLISAGNRNIVWLGTSDGQLFRSSDAGSSWNLLYPGLRRRQLVVDALVQSPENPDHLFAGGWDLRSSGGGLFESADAGRTWSQVKLPKSNVAVRGFAISRNNPAHRILGTGDGVFVTSDGGSSWQQRGTGMKAFAQVDSVAIDPVDPRHLFVGTWHLGFRSSDFGKTWIQNDKGMVFDSDMFTIAIDPRNPRNIFASACTGLYRSVDHGQSWTRLKVFPSSYLVRAQVVYIDPANSDRIFGGTTEGLLVSQDAGKTWKRVTPADWVINAVQVSPDGGKAILVGTELHGVMRSEDGGRSWSSSNRGFVSRSISRIASDSSSQRTLLVGEHSEGKIGGLYSFNLASGDWMRMNVQDMPGEGLTALLTLPLGRGRIAGTARGIFLQETGKGGWKPLSGPISKQTVYDFATDASHAWILAGTGDGIYRARSEDLEFRKVANDRFIPRVFCLLSANGNPGKVFAGTHLGILRSDDSGATWAVSSDGIPDAAIVECLVASPKGEDLILAGTTAGLFISKDGGGSWARFADGRLGVDIPSVIFLDSTGDRILAADNLSGGVLSSEDGGRHWEKIEDPRFGAPVRILLQDPSQPDRIYLGTATEGVYRLMLPPR